GRSDVEDLAADRQDRLGLAVARLLGAAARGIALDDEQLGLAIAFARAVGQLAGQAQLACVGRGLALDLALGLAPQAFVHPLHHRAEQRAAALHVARAVVVEVGAYRVLDEPGRLRRSQPVLGLAL